MMNEKFTIRDFIVYFLTGFLFTSVFSLTYPECISRNIESYKDYLAFIGFAALPTFYIIGHTIHAIDVAIFSRLGMIIYERKKIKSNFFTKLLHEVLNGHRIRGLIDKNWHFDKKFEDIVCFCSDSKVYAEAKYWSYLNDKFKGYVLILVLFSASAFFRSKFWLGIFLIFLALLFRERGKYFGKYYIISISRIYNHLNNNIK